MNMGTRYPGLFDSIIACYITFAVFIWLPDIFRRNPHYWENALDFIGHGSPKWAFCNGALVFHLILWLMYNGSLAICYYVQHPLIEQYKTEPHEPWPWNHPKQEKREQFWKLLSRSMLLILANNVLMSYPLSIITFDSASENGKAMSQSMADFPSTFTLAWQVAICLIIEDILFYTGHRLLHWPVMYRAFHKVHHEYHDTIGVASEYAHPFEYLLGNIIPFTIGPAVLQVHMFTFFIWAVVRLGKTAEAHSGYEFPFSPFKLLPFANPAAAHDFHHSTGFTSCYGSFLTIWDTLLGTTGDYEKHIQKKEDKVL